MLRLPLRFPICTGLIFAALSLWPSQLLGLSTRPAVVPDSGLELKIDGLGKGTAPIDGAWLFHIGDNPAWAQPATSDTAAGWEQISADKTWGAQGHPAYVGYAWYRKHLHLTAAPGASPEFALLIARIDNAYEIYWNGQLVGHNGTMPPDASWLWLQSAQTFGLGPIRDGVLAVRVWKAPLTSFDPDTLGGFNAAPLIGSGQAIADRQASLNYTWLRSRQYYFALQTLHALVMVLGLFAWLRNRSQRILLWVALFSGAPAILTLFVGMRLPFSYKFALGIIQPVFAMQDIGLWFLLLYLLRLDENPRLVRATRVLALISLTSTCLDGAITFLDWSNPWVASWVQVADGIFTAIFTLAEIFPVVQVVAALRKRLDSTRWVVAICACLTELMAVARIALSQGNRYTHWTIGLTLSQPLFTINGNVFTPQDIASTLLLLAIIYAVYRYVRDAASRQAILEQEFKSARELQQVLIPETLPELPGFAVTSAYRPAQEVGGDFFQIIPLEGEQAGSTLVLLGDVSGKGLRAAMTVSLIVGAARTLAKFAPRPADLLAELNVRLAGRQEGGFTTCLAMRLHADGHCTIASAGHPAPFLNQHEIELPGALPLGVMPTANYKEADFDLKEGDRFALYTDGLLEARNTTGEIFSFERLNALFATNPSAAQATDAAVDFGQDDDITVLTLTRLGRGAQSTTQLTAPLLAPA